MGEENKVEEKKEEKKKEEEAPEIVLKVDMHCEACARKVARALKGFEGVEEVKTDSKGSKVVVKGKAADPIKVCERLQKKSGKKVELISPLPKPQPPPEEQKKEEAKEPDKEEKKVEEPPAVVTVMLQVRMHCEACAQLLQKRIRKIKGVESVETDVGNDQVVVKGVVDPAKLADDVYKKTRRHVSVVTKEEEKKEEEKKEEEKKKDSNPEGDKKEGEAEGGGDKGSSEETKSFDLKRSEYWPTRTYHSDVYAYTPQIFSDENPNACSVM